MSASDSRKPGETDASPKSLDSLVRRLLVRGPKSAGTAPGTLLHTGERKVEKIRIRFIDYDADGIREETIDRIDECFSLADEPTVTWINIDGLHDTGVIGRIGERFDFHHLVMEDVVSPRQRPKVEDFRSYIFVTVKMLSFNAETQAITAEQVSLIVGERFVFSFQERPGDVFEPVRERLRHGKGRLRSRGGDYLAYTLIDAIVDSYFRILEEVGDQIEAVEDEVMVDGSVGAMQRIHNLKRETLLLRRSVWPLRELLGELYRGEVPLVKEETQVFVRDVYDHSVQVIDTVETLREVLSSTMDLYMSMVSNRMNEVMKVLTIIATIFIPLSFFAGVYGMNFEYMPELAVRWAYPTLLALMGAVAGGMLWLFYRKGWF